jgi:hypothetical protein
MPKAKKKVTAESLLARAESVMREGISEMSAEEFAKYKRESKKTIASIRANAGDCAGSNETHSQTTEALQA